MLAVDSCRPSKLYQYAPRPVLERALTLGEFRLQPAAPEAVARNDSGDQILPFGPKKSAAGGNINYLTLRLAHAWDEKLFDARQDNDCCLIIHDAEAFGERLHHAAQKLLPDWAGIDAAISYGMPSPLGAAFSKPRQDAAQKEWLFAWRPMQFTRPIHPVVVQIGSLESIAELRGRSQ